MYERISQTRKQTITEREGERVTVCKTGGEDTTQAHHTEPLSGMEAGKKTYATSETLVSSPGGGEGRTSITV